MPAESLETAPVAQALQGLFPSDDQHYPAQSASEAAAMEVRPSSCASQMQPQAPASMAVLPTNSADKEPAVLPAVIMCACC